MTTKLLASTVFNPWLLFRLQVSKTKTGSPTITPEDSFPLCFISYENEQMFICPNLPQTKYRLLLELHLPSSERPDITGGSELSRATDRNTHLTQQL